MSEQVADQLPVQVSSLDLAEITVMEDNTRIHDSKNKKVISDSVDLVGFARSIVLDEGNRTLAGAGTLEEARKRGATVIVVDVDDPNTLVAVRKSGLSEIDKAKYNMYDNRATDTSKNNVKAINRLVERFPEQQLLEGIFGPKEQEKLLKAQAAAQPLAAGGANDDGTPALEGEGEIRQESSIRMLPVFLTTENHPEVVRKLRQLGEAFGGITVMTDVVVETINRAHAEWVAHPETVDSTPQGRLPSEHELA